MSIKQTFIIATIAGGVLAAASCKKNLDVNQNPNIAHSATVDVMLPTGETYLGAAMGIDFEINGSVWAQYWTQNPNSSQYRNLENYTPTASSYEYPWTNMFYGLENLYQMGHVADSLKKKQYLAISLLLRAYGFQAVTDAWGDVPFKEALRGQPKDGGITSPHYDIQKSIYAGMLGLLDSANKLINPNDPSAPGTDDLIYAGDMGKWQRFSNTLRLRILLRLSQVDPATAQAGIAALYAQSGVAFLAAGEDAQISYASASGNNNPLYAEELGLSGTQNLAGSSTCIDSMNADNDYRGFAFYEYVPSKGVPSGLAQGNYSAIVAPGSFSIPTPYVGGDAGNPKSAAAPVKFLTGYESYFLQAEAKARGWTPGGNDAALFLSGVRASFDACSFAFTDQDIQLDSNTFLTSDYGYYAYINGDTLFGVPPAYWGIYPAGGTVQQKVKFIITQKWFSMCGNQGFEAWTEWRRTGYPDFFVLSAARKNGDVFPRRFIYPNSEITTNLNFPGIKDVTTAVYWDVH